MITFSIIQITAGTILKLFGMSDQSKLDVECWYQHFNPQIWLAAEVCETCTQAYLICAASARAKAYFVLIALTRSLLW